MYVNTYIRTCIVCRGSDRCTCSHFSIHGMCMHVLHDWLYIVYLCVGGSSIGSLLPAPAAPGDGSGQGAPP